MDKEQLIRSVGEEQYRAACRTAPFGTASSQLGTPDTHVGPGIGDLPHEIADLLWYGDLPHHEALELLFQVYEDLPAYGHLMYLTHVYKAFTSEERTRVRDWYRKQLERKNPAFRQPVEYSLWCDFFEHPDTVEEWWRDLAHPGRGKAVLRRLLSVSGPVPWALKRPVYEALLPAPRWHDAIFESLYASAFDVFGQIDREEAARLLGGLRIPRDHPGREELILELGRGGTGPSEAQLRR